MVLQTRRDDFRRTGAILVDQYGDWKPGVLLARRGREVLPLPAVASHGRDDHARVDEQVADFPRRAKVSAPVESQIENQSPNAVLGERVERLAQFRGRVFR